MESPNCIYINEKNCVKLKNRNLKDSEDAFLWDICDYLDKTSFVHYFSLLQNEVRKSKWNERLNFFMEYQNINVLYVDFPLKMKSPLLKGRLEQLLECLEQGLDKIKAGENYISKIDTSCKDICLKFRKPKQETITQFETRQKIFVEGINSVKNGIQSALQYLEMEIWNHENENPIDHLGEMYLQTMRVDPIIFSESEVPALKNYACQMISGTLLEV